METDHQQGETAEGEVLTPGTLLKRCREFNKISLADAAEATKIGKNYLAALEEDRSQEFASQAYRKGFMRIYAAYLGLNADDMVAMLVRDQQTPGTGLYSMKSQIELPKKQIWQRLMLPTLLLAAIIVTSLFISRRPSPPKKPETQQPQQAAIQAPVVQPAASSAKTPPASENMPASPALPAPPLSASGVALRMKVSQPGTLQVTIDSSASQSYELSAGDVIEWKAEKNVALDLSNPAGVELELNGRPIQSIGQAGKPAYVVIEPGGIKH